VPAAQELYSLWVAIFVAWLLFSYGTFFSCLILCCASLPFSSGNILCVCVYIFFLFNAVSPQWRKKGKPALIMGKACKDDTSLLRLCVGDANAQILRRPT